MLLAGWTVAIVTITGFCSLGCCKVVGGKEMGERESRREREQEREREREREQEREQERERERDGMDGGRKRRAEREILFLWLFINSLSVVSQPCLNLHR